MSVKKRVKEFALNNDLNINQFESIIGVSNGYVNSISKSMGLDKISIIIEKFPNLNIEWLLTGKGYMLKSDQAIEKSKDPNKGIPLIPFEAIAGWGEGDLTVVEDETEKYLVPGFKDLGIEFLIPVKGDSMIDTYLPGDILGCIKLKSSTFFQPNKVYVFDTTQGPLVKRVLPHQDQDHLTLVSDNEKYPPFDLPKSEIRAVALPLGLIRYQ